MATGKTTAWAATLDPADRGVLDPGAPTRLDRSPDVLVVGGGVLGLATAVAFRRAGVDRVLVIEAEHLAAGASGGAGGALAPALHPPTAPAALVDLARASLALYRDLDRDWNGTLGLRWLPSLLLLDEHAAARPWRPAPGTELLTPEQVAELEPDLAPVPAALLAPGQAHVHPLRLAAALARHAGSVATRTPMTGLTISRGRVVRVHTPGGDLRPGAVVLATGMAPAPWVRLPQRRVKGHLLTTQPGRVTLRHGVHTPHGGIGPLAGGGLLAGGTRDGHDQTAAVRPEVIASIRRWLGEVLPAARNVPVRHRWCCFRPTSADGLPVIDRVPALDNAWVTAGHGGDGLTLAPATGRALATWVTTGQQPASVAGFALARFA